ncbi:hypothetical protein OC842_002624 [Tilletia horrida]|uniref:Uncharacterized protein n=1 Tax=Tilletia horrida TaxID=155126 RepID=A0AAN6JKZ0_9BASI|nr:hypothetical protein OC842_002624 [Tilletia horrida]
MPMLLLMLASSLIASALAAAPPPPPALLSRRSDANDDDSNTNYTPNITMLNTVTDTIASSQRASWEQGTAAAAFLELWDAQWSVWAGTRNGPPYRPDHLDPAQARNEYPAKVLSIGLRSIAAQDGIGRLSSRVTGDESTASGSALDSASSGESVLIGAFVEGDIRPDFSTNTRGTWISAAARQLAFILNTVPRASNGAISHRFPDVQIWSDGVYMGPPFYAQYGLMTRNQTLLQLAYDQCRLYRDILRITQGTSTGLWAHIWAATTTATTNTTAGASAGTNATGPAFRWIDSNSWVTGNGWASAGMLRVAASIAQSPFASSMSSQVSDLTAWTREILDAAFPLADPATGLFHNYANDTSQFLDSAGSSLLAYSAFRLASMGVFDAQESARLVTPAERIYAAVQSGVGPLGDMTDGLDVVNVLSFNADSAHSSTESLSFLLLLSAARRDYAAGNVTGVLGPGTSNSGSHGQLNALGSAGSGGTSGSASSSSSSPIGAIVGGVLGGLVAGILATLLALYCLRRRQHRSGGHSEWNQSHSGIFPSQRSTSSHTAFDNNEKTPTGTGPDGRRGSNLPPLVIGYNTKHAASSSEDATADDPATAVEMDPDSEKYTHWKTGSSPSPDLRRGVSFKEGTNKSRSGSQRHHARKNTASSIGSVFGGGAGPLSRANSMLRRGGSERRRQAIRAQDEAEFDEDEVTVHGHGLGLSPELVDSGGDTQTRAPQQQQQQQQREADAQLGAGAAAAAAGAGLALAASRNHQNQTQTAAPIRRSVELAAPRSGSRAGAGSKSGAGTPMDRAPSSDSNSNSNSGSGGVNAHARTQSNSKPRKPVMRVAPPSSTQRQYMSASSDAEDSAAAPTPGAASGYHTPAGGVTSESLALSSGVPTPSSAPHRDGTAEAHRPTMDYFATPGAADPNRAPSTSSRGGGGDASGPVAVPPAPARPERHSRKPSSRAKALRSNRAQILDGTASTDVSIPAPAAPTSSSGPGGRMHRRSPSSGSMLSDSERAMRADEGAALKSRGRHHRHLSNASGSGSGSHVYQLPSSSAAATPTGSGAEETPVPALPAPAAAMLSRTGSQDRHQQQALHQRSVRGEDARALRTYLAAAEEEKARALAWMQQQAALSGEGRSASRSATPSRANSGANREAGSASARSHAVPSAHTGAGAGAGATSHSTRSRSAERPPASAAGAGGTAMQRTGSGSGSGSGSDSRAAPAPAPTSGGRSIRLVNKGANPAPPSSAQNGFSSVSDVLAAGIQYPNPATASSGGHAIADRGVRTASTRTAGRRVPSASGGGGGGGAGAGVGGRGTPF